VIGLHHGSDTCSPTPLAIPEGEGAMKKTICMAISTVAFGFITGQPLGAAQSQGAAAPTTAAPATQASRSSADQQVTVTGCIQREADYRRSVGAGGGGAAGTTAGVGNEFILANATMGTSSPGSAATSGANPPTTTGTAGTTSSRAYELTGPNEGQASTHVGKRVEITGKMKASDAAGGPTGNVPGSQELHLSEIEVSSIRETMGTCTTAP
jgi:hypothetical protein